MKNATAFILFLFIFCSCTKEDNNEKDNSLPEEYKQFAVSAERLQQPSKLLKREFTYNTDFPLITNLKRFSYDAEKRCTKIELGILDSTLVIPEFKIFETLTFHYTGASVLPVSLTSVKTIQPNDQKTYYFKYDNNGLKVLDSVRLMNQQGYVNRLIITKYNNNKVYTTPELDGSTTNYSSVDTLELLAGGNIGRFSIRHRDPMGDKLLTYHFTYDQYINPYSKLNIANSVYFLNKSIGLSYTTHFDTQYSGVTKNNVSSWTSGTHSAIYKFTYDNDNYPVRKEFYLDGATTSNRGMLFEYY